MSFFTKVQVVILLFLFGSLFAQNSRITGKIVGEIIDSATEEPLAGVNIVLENTFIGASTDADGYYSILNVPAGKYTVLFMFVGYKTVKMTDVEIRPDYTSNLSIGMNPEIMEGEAIVVTAEKPLVQKDITASVKEISALEIQRSPVTNFNQIVAQQIGAVETGRGRRSGGIHIRGGRNNEIVFYVDGVNSNDPFLGSAAVNIDNNEIEQLNILSGGFNAEYGESMSGVVQIITKPPSPEKFSFNTEVTSDGLFNNTEYDWGYNKYYLRGTGPLPGLKKYKGAFSASATFEKALDRTPSITFQGHNNMEKLTGSLKFAFQPIPSKLRVELNGRFTIGEEFLYSHSRSDNPFWLNQGFKRKNGDNRISLTVSHTLSEHTWYDFTFARFENYQKYSAQNGKHFKDWRALSRGLDWVKAAEDNGWYDRRTGQFTGVTEEEAFFHYYSKVANGGKGFVQKDADGNYVWNSLEAEREARNARVYDTGTWEIENGKVVYREFTIPNYQKYLAGDKQEIYNYYGDIDNFYGSSRDPLGNFRLDFVPRWHDHTNIYMQGELSVSSQVNKHNFMKIGTWARTYDLDFTDIQFLNSKPYFDSYQKTPMEVAAYIQDKFEFNDLTINAGVRWDYWDADSENPIDVRNLDLGKEKTEPKSQLSPRFGISFAASSQTKIYAHYGQFFQRPNLSDMFQNLNADISNGLPLIGNPNLPPQKSTSYEIGFKQALTEDISLDVSALYKDVTNLLSTDQVSTLNNGVPANYTIYLVNDFSKIKGLEIELKKRMVPGLSGSITYSFLDAKGTGSDSRDFYYDFLNTDSELPRKEYPLDFDITHDLKGKLNYWTPADGGPSIFGFKPFSDTNFHFYLSANTGAAYTPTDFRGNALEKGSARLPSYFKLDLRFDKYFHPDFADIELDFFIDIRNVFNIENVVQVYTNTGKADDNDRKPVWDPANLGTYGSFEKYGYTSAYNMYLADVAGWKKAVKSPSFYSAPRIIRTGLMINF